MAQYLLDTDVCVELIKHSEQQALSCQIGYGYNCNHVTIFLGVMLKLFYKLKRGEKTRTLDSPNWEFAVTKIPVYLLQSPVFLS